MHPMAYVGIGLGILISLIILISYVLCKVCSVKCPECGHMWHPKFFAILFSLHSPEGNFITCPNCNEVVCVSFQKHKK